MNTVNKKRTRSQLTEVEYEIILQWSAQGRSARSIAGDLGVSYQSVYNYIEKVTTWSRNTDKCAYPAIREYCQNHFMSLADLSNLLDFNQISLRPVLYGRKPMPIRMADRFCARTHIPYSELKVVELDTPSESHEYIRLNGDFLQKLMEEHDDTIISLSAKVGISYHALSDTLKAPQRHMGIVALIYKHYNIPYTTISAEQDFGDF